MPEPQGDAPVASNKDKTSFTNTNAANKSVPASRMDQTSGGTKHSMPMNARPASPHGQGK